MFNVEEGLNSHSSASSSDSEYDDSNQSNDSVGPCGIDKLNLVSNRLGSVGAKLTSLRNIIVERGNNSQARAGGSGEPDDPAQDAEENPPGNDGANNDGVEDADDSDKTVREKYGQIVLGGNYSDNSGHNGYDNIGPFGPFGGPGSSGNPHIDKDLQLAKTISEFELFMQYLISINVPHEIFRYIQENLFENDHDLKKAVINALPLILELDFKKTKKVAKLLPTYRDCIMSVLRWEEQHEELLEMVCLTSINNMVIKLGSPPEILRNLFVFFWDEQIICTNTFLTWIDVPTTNKDTALKELEYFYNYMQDFP